VTTPPPGKTKNGIPKPEFTYQRFKREINRKMGFQRGERKKVAKKKSPSKTSPLKNESPPKEVSSKGTDFLAARRRCS